MNPGLSQSQPHSDARALRHDIRGRMNALVLCSSALDETLSTEEALEFLHHIESTTDKLISLLEQLESLPA